MTMPLSKTKKINFEQDKLQIIPTMNSKMPIGNSAWIGTFQLVWNDFMQEVTKGSVEFVDGNNETVDNLNKKEFTRNDINDNSYYINQGIVSPELKEEIEKGVKNKLNETSDILNQMDFSYNPLSILFYAMLKKEFQFIEKFEELEDDFFGDNENDFVEYFGIASDDNPNLYKNISVLFYEKDNFAVKLHTKTYDEIILYRTDDFKNFSEYFKDVNLKTAKYNGSREFDEEDYLKAPKFDFSVAASFSDVENKVIKNTNNAMITKTLETIKFKMDECGVKLKSEAMLSIMIEGAPPEIEEYRSFEFDKSFVLFLMEKGKQVPYFAMRVVDAAKLNQ